MAKNASFCFICPWCLSGWRRLFLCQFHPGWGGYFFIKFIRVVKVICLSCYPCLLVWKSVFVSQVLRVKEFFIFLFFQGGGCYLSLLSGSFITLWECCWHDKQLSKSAFSANIILRRRYKSPEKCQAFGRHFYMVKELICCCAETHATFDIHLGLS